MGQRPKTLDEVVKSDLTEKEKARLGGELTDEQRRELEQQVLPPEERKKLIERHHKKDLN